MPSTRPSTIINISIDGTVDPADIASQVVEAIKEYERTRGSGWRR